MILSASRRTDLPNYYSDWFLNRVREGFLDVRNPFNARQISRIRCPRRRWTASYSGPRTRAPCWSGWES